MLKEPLSPAAKKALDQANLHLLSADGDLANVFSAGRNNRRVSNEVSDESLLLLSEVSVELQHALSELRRAAQAPRPRRPPRVPRPGRIAPHSPQWYS